MQKSATVTPCFFASILKQVETAIDPIEYMDMKIMAFILLVLISVVSATLFPVSGSFNTSSYFSGSEGGAISFSLLK